MNYIQSFKESTERIRRWLTTEDQDELDDILNIANDMGFETNQKDLLNRSDSEKPCWSVEISRFIDNEVKGSPDELYNTSTDIARRINGILGYDIKITYQYYINGSFGTKLISLEELVSNKRHKPSKFGQGTPPWINNFFQNTKNKIVSYKVWIFVEVPMKTLRQQHFDKKNNISS